MHGIKIKPECWTLQNLPKDLMPHYRRLNLADRAVRAEEARVAAAAEWKYRRRFINSQLSASIGTQERLNGRKSLAKKCRTKAFTRMKAASHLHQAPLMESIFLPISARGDCTATTFRASKSGKKILEKCESPWGLAKEVPSPCIKTRC